MPQQPLSGPFIIGRDPVLLHKCKDDLQYLPVHRNTQRTVCIRDDVMRPSGVESGHRVSFPVCPERELGLIAVSEGLVHADSRIGHAVQKLRRESSDPLEIPPYLPLLERKLLLIGHLLDLTSAAFSGKCAPRLYSGFGRLQDFHQPGISVVLFRLHDLGFHTVADHRILDKQRIAVHLSDSFPVHADIFDVSRDYIIFLHILLLFIKAGTHPRICDHQMPFYVPDVLLKFDSKSLLYPSHSVPVFPLNISVSVCIFASALSARLRASASASAGFFGEPYSSSP